MGNNKQFVVASLPVNRYVKRGESTGGDTSGLVPYAGAIANVDLAEHTINTSKVIINDGYVSPPNNVYEISSPTTNDDFNIKQVSTNGRIRLDFNLLSSGLEQIYVLPANNGTLALTSDITGTNSGTNTGDQTTIAGITGTKAEFDTACTDGDFLYVGDVSSVTLQTDGSTNGSQSTLNLVPGTNIDLTDNGTGSVTIDATGGGISESLAIAYAVAL